MEKDMTDPKKNPLIPDPLGEKEEVPELSPEYERKAELTLPELLEKFEGNTLNVGGGIQVFCAGGTQRIIKGGLYVELADLSLDECRAIKKALEDAPA